MTAFDAYADSVLLHNTRLNVLRPAVEKELFHQDILRLINATGMMKKLVFMGGTCLRLCYDSERLSEDLDFSTEFEITDFEASNLSQTIKAGLSDKYGLNVEVSKPEKETDTETWKIKIDTNVAHNNLPSQHIHLDICHYKSYLTELRLVKNLYSISNLSPLFIRAEKLEEILIDKLIAFAFRKRIKNRDLWDIYTLYCMNIKLDCTVLEKKIADKKHDFDDFQKQYLVRQKEIEKTFPSDFNAELSRFLTADTFDKSILSSPEGPIAFHTIINDYQKIFLHN